MFWSRNIQRSIKLSIWKKSCCQYPVGRSFSSRWFAESSDDRKFDGLSFEWFAQCSQKALPTYRVPIALLNSPFGEHCAKVYKDTKIFSIITQKIVWLKPKPYEPQYTICIYCMYCWYHFRFANPIYVDGEYPPIMRFQINQKSAEMGLKESRLPYFTEEEKKMVKGKIGAVVVIRELWKIKW